MATQQIPVRITGDAGSLERAFRGAGRTGRRELGALESSGRRVGGVFGSLRSQLVGFGTALAGGLALRELTSDSLALESATVKLRTQLGLSAQQAAAVEAQALGLATTYGVAADASVNAGFAIQSAGLRGAAAQEALEAATKGAAIGLGEARDIGLLSAAAMTAWGSESLTATRSTEILAAAVKAGNLEASELAGSLGQALAPAATLGVEFEELAGSVAFYTRLGVGASEATTAVRQTMNQMLKPSRQAQQVLDDIGLSAQDLQTMVGERGLVGTLQHLRAELNDDQAFARVIGSAEALGFAYAVTGEGAADFADIQRDMASSAGSLDEAWRIQAGTIETRVKSAWQFIKTEAVELTTGVLSGVADAVGFLFTTSDERRAAEYRDRVAEIKEEYQAYAGTDIEPQRLQLEALLKALRETSADGSFEAFKAFVEQYGNLGEIDLHDSVRVVSQLERAYSDLRATRDEAVQGEADYRKREQAERDYLEGISELYVAIPKLLRDYGAAEHDLDRDIAALRIAAKSRDVDLFDERRRVRSEYADYLQASLGIERDLATDLANEYLRDVQRRANADDFRIRKTTEVREELGLLTDAEDELRYGLNQSEIALRSNASAVDDLGDDANDTEDDVDDLDDTLRGLPTSIDIAINMAVSRTGTAAAIDQLDLFTEGRLDSVIQDFRVGELQRGEFDAGGDVPSRGGRGGGGGGTTTSTTSTTAPDAQREIYDWLLGRDDAALFAPERLVEFAGQIDRRLRANIRFPGTGPTSRAGVWERLLAEQAVAYDAPEVEEAAPLSVLERRRRDRDLGGLRDYDTYVATSRRVSAVDRADWEQAWADAHEDAELTRAEIRELLSLGSEIVDPIRAAIQDEQEALEAAIESAAQVAADAAATAEEQRQSYFDLVRQQPDHLRRAMWNSLVDADLIAGERLSEAARRPEVAATHPVFRLRGRAGVFENDRFVAFDEGDGPQTAGGQQSEAWWEASGRAAAEWREAMLAAQRATAENTEGRPQVAVNAP